MPHTYLGVSGFVEYLQGICFPEESGPVGKINNLQLLLGSQPVKGPSRMATPKTRERAQLVMYLVCSCEEDVGFNPQNQREVGSGSTRLQSQCSYCKINGEKGVPRSYLIQVAATSKDLVVNKKGERTDTLGSPLTSTYVPRYTHTHKNDHNRNAESTI